MKGSLFEERIPSTHRDMWCKGEALIAPWAQMGSPGHPVILEVFVEGRDLSIA